MKRLARKAQLEKHSSLTERHINLTVYRSSPRAWFTYAHLCFGLLFVWALVARFKNSYRNSLAGIDAEIGDQVEFGLFKKLETKPQEESLAGFKLNFIT